MIGDVIGGVLPLLQRQAQSRMVDRVRIVRVIGRGDPDPVTGVVQPIESDVYVGPAEVKATARQGTDVDAGEARDVATQYTVKIMAGATGARDGDTVRVTDSADDLLRLAVLRVTGVELGAQVTARRLSCELVEVRGE